MAVIASPQSTYFTGGQVAAGGALYVYKTGTTTLVTLYSDGGLTIPITNPITLDVNGEASFYVSTATNLKLVSYSAVGSLLETLDPVYPISATSSSLSNTTAIGGYLNKFRNPGFDVMQRNSTATITAGTPAYSFDGWIIGSTGANVIYSAGSPASTPNFTTENFLNITGATNVTDTFIKQRIESLIAAPLAGQTVTAQITIYNTCGTPITPTITIKVPNSADNWGSSTTVINGATLQTAANAVWTTLSYTFICPVSAVNGLEVAFDFGAALNANTKSISFTGADIRVTTNLTTGQTASLNIPLPELRNIQTELAYCQRYLPVFNSQNTANNIAMGQCISSTQAFVVFTFNVPTRALTTTLAISSPAHVSLSAANGTLTGCSSALFDNPSLYSATIQFTVASGLSAGNATIATFTNASGQIIFAGAEL
jgi:hypothetical protein